jgi:hypothetical protein
MRAIAFAVFAMLAAVPAATALEWDETFVEKACYQRDNYPFASEGEYKAYVGSRIRTADYTMNHQLFSFSKEAGATEGTCYKQRSVPSSSCARAQLSASGLTLLRAPWGPWEPC